MRIGEEKCLNKLLVWLHLFLIQTRKNCTFKNVKKYLLLIVLKERKFFSKRSEIYAKKDEKESGG